MLKDEDNNFNMDELETARGFVDDLPFSEVSESWDGAVKALSKHVSALESIRDQVQEQISTGVYKEIEVAPMVNYDYDAKITIAEDELEDYDDDVFDDTIENEIPMISGFIEEAGFSNLDEADAHIVAAERIMEALQNTELV